MSSTAANTTAVQDVEGAKQYLAKHNVHRLFEQLATLVITERPEDPLVFLAAKINEMADNHKKSQKAAGAAAAKPETAAAKAAKGKEAEASSGATKGSKPTPNKDKEGKAAKADKPEDKPAAEEKAAAPAATAAEPAPAANGDAQPAAATASPAAAKEEPAAKPADQPAATQNNDSTATKKEEGDKAAAPEPAATTSTKSEEAKPAPAAAPAPTESTAAAPAEKKTEEQPPKPASAPASSEQPAAAKAEPAPAAAAAPTAVPQRLVFVLSAPQAGCATQCKKLAADRPQQFSYAVVSELHAEVAKEDSDRGRATKDALEKGTPVPLETTIAAIRAFAAKQSLNEYVLIHGMPPDVASAKQLEAAIEPVEFLLQFDTSDAVCTQRVAAAAVAAGATAGDETNAAAAKKVEAFRSSTRELLDHYRSINRLHVVNGELPVDEVFAKTLAVFKK